VFLNSADLVEYAQADGSKSKTLFVRIPFRSLAAFRKVSEKVVAHLEAKFNWPVVVIATRTIISKHGKRLPIIIPLILAKRHRTQKRPRSRTLTAVHAAILEDIVILIIVSNSNLLLNRSTPLRLPARLPV